jgi:hypothetical protein
MFNSNAPSKDDLPTSRQLAISTVVAAAAAAVILTTIVLPSEYGIDPIGAGKVLGLTEMGEIKTQLAEEAEADRVREVDAPAKSELPKDQGTSLMQTIGSFFVSTAHAEEVWKNEMSVTLAPGESTEIKLSMKQGAKATYSWTAEGGVLNYDLHADGDGSTTSYKKGRAQPSDAGEFEAAFDGWHGWFWRNRTGDSVMVTIKASGDFTEMQKLK